MKINLNDQGTFRLSETGRSVWREHCKNLRELMAQMGIHYVSPHTGEETTIKLALWAFIEIFGAPELWQISGPNPLADMNVEVSS